MESSHTFEVLIASLNGSRDIYANSNLSCRCIIANQTDEVSVYRDEKLTVVNTDTRGVGKNRNISLIYSDAEYILFGDDDVSYVDGLEEIVVGAFNANPKADVLIFNIETKGSDLIKRRINTKGKRVRTYNYMNYGAVRIACRRASIKKANIWFTELFGGGARFSAGEDTNFLADCLKRKLKIYTVPVKIGEVDQSTSTWFTGYNDKYFTDKGALFKHIYPRTYRLFCLYYSFKMRSKERGFFKNYKDCKRGARLFKELKK